MKKLFALLLALIVLGTMIVGCDKPENPSDGESSSETEKKDDTSDTEELSEPHWSDDGVLSILTIGNSFSDDAMEYVYAIAESLGVETIHLGNLFIGGATINMHLEALDDKAPYLFWQNTNGKWAQRRSTLKAALQQEQWDFISMQQGAGDGRVSDPETYKRLPELISYVRKYGNKDAKLVWHMTWADETGSTRHEIQHFGGDQNKVYEGIVAAVKSEILTNSDISLVIPNGTAVQNSRTSYLGDTITRDKFHLTYGYGRYLAGLTMVATLTGLPIDDIEFAPQEVDDRMKAVAIEAVNNALKTPFAVTPASDAEQGSL